MASKGMFTALLEAQPPEESKKEEPPVRRAKPTPAVADVPKPPTQSLSPFGDLGEFADKPYHNLAFRFTEKEAHGIELSCINLGAQLGKKVPHQTLIRALLRLADQEWMSNPVDNRLLSILLSLKD